MSDIPSKIWAVHIQVTCQVEAIITFSFVRGVRSTNSNDSAHLIPDYIWFSGNASFKILNDHQSFDKIHIQNRSQFWTGYGDCGNLTWSNDLCWKIRSHFFACKNQCHSPRARGGNLTVAAQTLQSANICCAMDIAREIRWPKLAFVQCHPIRIQRPH